MESLRFVMTTSFYPPYHLGGDAVHVYYLANELAKIGHEVHVIHSIDAYNLKRSTSPSNDFDNHENVQIHSIKSPFGKLSSLSAYLLGSSNYITKEVTKIVNEVKPDVLHHHNISLLGANLLSIKAPRVIYTAHDYWLVCQLNNLLRSDGKFCDIKSNCAVCSVRSGRPPQLWRLFRGLDKMVRNIDVVISPSEFMMNLLKLGGLTIPIQVIPNFSPIPEESISKIDENYFLFVGVLEGREGVFDAVRAFQSITTATDAHFKIVGSGPGKKDLDEITQSNEKIEILGHVDNKKLSSLYANAIAVVLPSIWPENCPLVALESLSYGTPIIAYNNGGLPEIINTTNACIGVKAGDVDGLARAMRMLVEKSKIQLDLSIKAKKEYLNNYIPAVYMERYLELMD